MNKLLVFIILVLLYFTIYFGLKWREEVKKRKEK